VTLLKLPFAAVLLVSLLAARSPAQTAHPAQRSSRAIPAPSCKGGTYTFSGIVKKGETFSRAFGGFLFKLLPIDNGWAIYVSHGEQGYLANFTPPRQGPNPIYIEGWHFRNQANTGPNTGDVNTPQERREFFFSPKFGGCIPEPDNAPPAEFEAATHDGSGVVEITDLTLGNLKPGETADIEEMKFTVLLTVAPFACEPCRTKSNPNP